SPSHSQTNFTDDHTYDDSAGEGTFAYVIATGVNIKHPEFEGRASHGFDVVNGREPMRYWNPHGTMVASALAAKTYGVAKKASIIDVRVVKNTKFVDECHVLQGFQWTVRHITGTRGRMSTSVINLRIAFLRSDAINDAFDAAYGAGLLIVAAAGNRNMEVVRFSPASEPSIITVGAVDENDVGSQWGYGFGSNFGLGIDIFAPGTDVPVVGTHGVEPMSGTSTAAPLVAGLALYLKAKEGLETRKDTVDRLLEISGKGIVKDARGSPTRLAYLG
ncbi:subtilisin-like protein, partial [Lentithecium fluviatile CBS 122367]